MQNKSIALSTLLVITALSGCIVLHGHQGIPGRVHTTKRGEHRILRSVLALCRLGLGVGLPRILPVLTEA